eukprot:m51a1_g8513 hypothetical protein (146) ;mRNA; r:83215-83979
MLSVLGRAKETEEISGEALVGDAATLAQRREPQLSVLDYTMDLFDEVGAMPDPEPRNLPDLYKAFQEAAAKAAACPGTGEGDDYAPTNEELVAGELGERLVEAARRAGAGGAGELAGTAVAFKAFCFCERDGKLRATPRPVAATL